MLKIAVLAALFAWASADINDDFAHFLSGQSNVTEADLQEMYSQYQMEFGVNDARRFLTFAENVREMIVHNSDPAQTYEQGINQFTHMSYYELRDMYLMTDYSTLAAPCGAKTTDKYFENTEVSAAPTNWDWRTHGGVTPVKNQGSCGSCWAFSATGAVEGHLKIKYADQRDLSEQQLVDCATGKYGNHGCGGGWQAWAMDYITDVGGQASEHLYPYTGKNGQCYYTATMKSAEVHAGGVRINWGAENDIKEALYKWGPVSVALDVEGKFFSYRRGIFRSTTCSKNTLNHAVLAVGYGVDNGCPYWIVKNSWGTSWGDKGFFKIARDENMCGIGDCGVYPYWVWETPKEPTIASL